jgi:hypothetical protein
VGAAANPESWIALTKAPTRADEGLSAPTAVPSASMADPVAEFLIGRKICVGRTGEWTV